MAEYTKLNSEDTGGYRITKLLNENTPFNRNIFSKFNKNQETDKEDFSSSYFNKLSNSLSLKINGPKEETFANKTRKGNMKMFIFNKNNEPYIVLGPDWMNSLIMIILFIYVVIYYFYYFKNSIAPKIRFYGIIISIIQVILYLFCFLKNPGIPPKTLWIENYFKNKNNDTNKNYSIKICKDCKIIIESTESIEHCKECNVCVMDRVSHNIWIGKCIGRKNKYYYYCFVFVTCFLILYLLFAFFSIPFNKNSTK